MSQIQQSTSVTANNTRDLTKSPELIKRAAGLYESMHGGVFGAGTDEDLLISNLKGLKPEEVKAVKEIYAKVYQRDLVDDVKSELSGGTLNQALALLDSNPVKQAAVAIGDALSGLGTNEAGLKKALLDYKGDKPELEREYELIYGSKLRDDIKADLSSVEADEVIGILDGDKVSIAAARLNQAMNGLGTDLEECRKALSELSKVELALLPKKYQERYGESLSDAFKGDLSGDLLSEILALSEGNKAQADAIRLKTLVEEEDPVAIQELFIGKSEEERDALLTAYNKNNSMELELGLTGIFSAQECDKISSAIHSGKLSLAQEIHTAVNGLGTNANIDSLLERLGSLPSNEALAVQKEYQNKYGETLETALRGDLGGRSLNNAILYLNGLPEDPAQKEIVLAQRTILQIQNEDSGLSGALLGVVSDKMDRMRAAAEEAQKILDKGNLTAEDIARLRECNVLMGAHRDSVSSAKESVTEGVATAAATVGAAGVIVASGGTATPGVLAALAATGGGVSYAGARIVGEGLTNYDSDGFVRDLGIGAAEGVANATGAGVAAKVVTKTMTSQAAKAAVVATVDGAYGGAVGGIADSATSTETWNNGVVSGIENIAGAALTQGVIGGIAGGGIATGLNRLSGATSVIPEVAPSQRVSSTMPAATATTNYAPQSSNGIVLPPNPFDIPPAPLRGNYNQPQTTTLNIIPPNSSFTSDGLPTNPFDIPPAPNSTYTYVPSNTESQLTRVYRNPVASVERKLRSMKPDSNPLIIGDREAAIFKMSNEVYMLFPGKEVPTGVFVDGKELPINFMLELKPNSKIRIGDSDIDCSKLIPEDPNHPIRVQLQKEKKITVGSSNECDIIINHNEVKDLHFSIVQRGKKFYVFDEQGCYVSRAGKQFPITEGVPVSAGTKIMINGKQIQIPIDMVHHSQIELDPKYQQWLKETPTIKRLDSPIRCNLSQMDITESETNVLVSVLKKLEDVLPPEIRAVDIVDNIGKVSGRDIGILPDKSCLTINRKLLQDPKKLEEALVVTLDKIDLLKSRIDDTFNFGEPTILPHEMPEGSFYIGNNSNKINGGVSHELERFFSIDDTKDPVLRNFYDRFYKRVEGKQPKEILQEVYNYVKQNIEYDSVIQERIIESFPENGIIPIGEFIKAKGAVCHEHALICAYMVEKLIKEGKLPNYKVSTGTSAVPDLNRIYSHKWCEVVTDQGEVFILDVAQKVFGPVQYNMGGWLYVKPEGILDQATYLMES